MALLVAQVTRPKFIFSNMSLSWLRSCKTISRIRTFKAVEWTDSQTGRPLRILPALSNRTKPPKIPPDRLAALHAPLEAMQDMLAVKTFQTNSCR